MCCETEGKLTQQEALHRSRNFEPENFVSHQSVASFLFYQKNPIYFGGGWQKLCVDCSGGMASGKDLFDTGI